MDDIEEIEEIGEAEEIVTCKVEAIGDSEEIDEEAHDSGLQELSGDTPPCENEEERKTQDNREARRGLLALTSEIEFFHPVNIVEEPEEELNTEIDVVSPFSSMFSALDINEEIEHENEKPRDESL